MSLWGIVKKTFSVAAEESEPSISKSVTLEADMTWYLNS